jgi:hypothetical protein
MVAEIIRIREGAARQAPPPLTVSIPLSTAMLCLSCNHVYQGGQCPRCGDPYGWLLGKWLTRAA